MTEDESRKAFEFYEQRLIATGDSADARKHYWFRAGFEDAIEWAQTWRPMKTAPRDGVAFLMLVRDGSYRRVYEAMWDSYDDAFGVLDGLVPAHHCLGWLPLPPMPKAEPK